MSHERLQFTDTSNSSILGFTCGNHRVRSVSFPSSVALISSLTCPSRIVSSTATGKASDKGAHNTVNGYMAFVLFSVAGLACTCPRFMKNTFRTDVRTSPPLSCIFPPFPLWPLLPRTNFPRARARSHTILGVDDIHADTFIRWRVMYSFFPLSVRFALSGCKNTVCV